MARLSWAELCAMYAASDGLHTRSSGPWAGDKLATWHTYVQIASEAMKNNRTFSGGLSYVDLFSGPGVCQVRRGGALLPGSPLIAAHAPVPFRWIVACDIDKECTGALRTRLDLSPAKGRYSVLTGDCNERIKDVISKLPDDTLTLAMIDPQSLHVRFETIKTLCRARRVDMLIFFADAIDIMRNVQEYYYDNPDSPLDHFLGLDSEWRTDWDALKNRSGRSVRDLFLRIYRRQLAKIGYRLSDDKVIENKRGPLYRLVFTTQHELGMKFWYEAKKAGRDGTALF